LPFVVAVDELGTSVHEFLIVDGIVTGGDHVRHPTGNRSYFLWFFGPVIELPIRSIGIYTSSSSV